MARMISDEIAVAAAWRPEPDHEKSCRRERNCGNGKMMTKEYQTNAAGSAANLCKGLNWNLLKSSATLKNIPGRRNSPAAAA